MRRHDREQPTVLSVSAKCKGATKTNRDFRMGYGSGRGAAMNESVFSNTTETFFRPCVASHEDKLEPVKTTSNWEGLNHILLSRLSSAYQYDMRILRCLFHEPIFLLEELCRMDDRASERDPCSCSRREWLWNPRLATSLYQIVGDATQGHPGLGKKSNTYPGT